MFANKPITERVSEWPVPRATRGRERGRNRKEGVAAPGFQPSALAPPQGQNMNDEHFYLYSGVFFPQGLVLS